MDQADARVKLYGTDEPAQDMRHVAVGPLSFLSSQEGLRRISWHGTELVRALAWPIRDENWGTYTVDVVQETVDESGAFEASLTLAVGDGALMCALRLRASPSGEVSADLTMTPGGGAFSTNRAGFTVLHPIKGFAGAPLHVSHADGTSDATVFPARVQPDQPVKDIAGLRYGLGAHAVDISFGGEVFEMEDQRNWSDASYKTYCVPLVHPFTYDITHATRQSVHMTFSGDPAAATTAHQSRPAVQFETLPTPTPEIGLAMQGDWLPAAPEPALDVAHLLLRVSPGEPNIAELCALAQSYPAVDLEIVLPDDCEVEGGLRDVAHALAANGIAPKRVIALREAYLSSHQPVGPWPEGPAPNDMFDVVRAVFPNAAIGGGMMTNFTELNRCRPDITRCDYVTHSLTPIVHASDDLSVLETLETLPQIFASTEALAGGLPYRLGLATIGMRTNPYGAAVAENPAQVRRTMAQIDPRHHGLFGAAYAVGVLAAAAESRIEAICLGSPAGPFEMSHPDAGAARRGGDRPAPPVYPLFHVVRAAAAMAGRPRVGLKHLPDGVVAYGAVIDGGLRVIMANVSGTPHEVMFDDSISIMRLDLDTFDDATASADWLNMSAKTQGTNVALPPYSVAFLERASS